jgi:bifunctional polynucleotide phosphatase/kinase
MIQVHSKTTEEIEQNMQDVIIHTSQVQDTTADVRTKFAIFDYDGTLVKPKDGRKFPKAVDDWQYTRPSVPEVVREYGRTHHIVIVTDQSKLWKIDQIRAVTSDLDLGHLTVVIGVQTQKPSTDLFYKALPNFRMAESAFYVGDAAGRQGDWSDKDKVFAQNINVAFMTPEETFPLEMPTQKTALDIGSGLVGAGLVGAGLVGAGIVGSGLVGSLPMPEREVIIMVGYPAAGKSTIVRDVFGPAHYHCVSGDVLKTPAAMVKDAEKHIGHQSVVFDSTAGRKAKRAVFVNFAKKHKLPARVLWVNTTIDDSMERNKQRATDGAHRVPDVAFYVYRKHFDPPDESEGFQLLTL